MKEWGAEIFRKIRPQICQRPFIYYLPLLTTALWTSLESVCNIEMSILSPECCYSLWTLWTLWDFGNNASNPPRYWQQHNEPSLILATVLQTLHVATTLWTLLDGACSDFGTSACGSAKRIGKLSSAYEKAYPSVVYLYSAIRNSFQICS